MRTLYMECNMGAAGDMLTAALLSLFDEPGQIVEELNALHIPGVSYTLCPVKKSGICGYQMHVHVHGEEEGQETVSIHETEQAQETVPHTHVHSASENGQHVHGKETPEHMHHHHTSMGEIREIISNLSVDEHVKADALAVFGRIAEAESRVHGEPVEAIHFHEVGSMDAVADVVAVCYLIGRLHPDRIVASPVRTGFGQVRCAHGILPVPAPAVLLLTENMPVYGGNIEGEFLTPTGAALLGHFVSEYGILPVMRVQKTGYGMGAKEFEAVNCVRAMLGEEQEKQLDEIVELCCNLDDMIPENIGYVTGLLMEEGALDVYTTNIQMKKNRPGILLTCMCHEAEKEKFLQLIFSHTTTLGVREYFCRRYGLKRHVETVTTKYGDVHVKCASGYGVEKRKFEYEDIAAIAKETGKAVETVKKELSEFL